MEEEKYKELALLLKKHGRVVVVMAFDEEDQAVTALTRFGYVKGLMIF